MDVDKAKVDNRNLTGILVKINAQDEGTCGDQSRAP